MKKMLTGISAIAVLALMSSAASAAPVDSNATDAKASSKSEVSVVLTGEVKPEFSITASESAKQVDFQDEKPVEFTLNISSNQGADVIFASGYSDSYVAASSDGFESEITLSSVSWKVDEDAAAPVEVFQSAGQPKIDLGFGRVNKAIKVSVTHNNESVRAAAPGKYSLTMSFVAVAK